MRLRLVESMKVYELEQLKIHSLILILLINIELFKMQKVRIHYEQEIELTMLCLLMLDD